MKLSLDHTQRLNLHALMGAQRASVDEVRLWWRLQDMIDLSAEEKVKIGYRLERVGEMMQPVWDPVKILPVREYELTADEFAKVERIIREWQPGFVAAADRRWLEPLLAQFEPASPNGHAATETQIPARHRA
jgi:hypothetical protein